MGVRLQKERRSHYALIDTSTPDGVPVDHASSSRRQLRIFRGHTGLNAYSVCNYIQKLHNTLYTNLKACDSKKSYLLSIRLISDIL